MSDFEREIVNCLNRFFTVQHIPGYAYRLRQNGPANQKGAVLADSPDPSWCLYIGCKSIVDKKLYFSQHFHAGRNKFHPVDEISEFLLHSRRAGFLAVEFRNRPGNKKEAFLIPWPIVASHFKASRGITIEDARTCIVLSVSKNGYLLESLNAK